MSRIFPRSVSPVRRPSADAGMRTGAASTTTITTTTTTGTGWRVRLGVSD